MVAVQGRVAVSPIWMERLLGSDCVITVCAVCVGVCASMHTKILKRTLMHNIVIIIIIIYKCQGQKLISEHISYQWLRGLRWMLHYPGHLPGPGSG